MKNIDGKTAATKIIEILKAVVTDGQTQKAQFQQVYLKVKKIDPTIDKIYLTVGQSFNDASKPKEEAPKVEAKEAEPTEPIADPAANYAMTLEGMNASQVKGFAKIEAKKANQTTKDFLVGLAKIMGVDASGKIDDLANAIHEKVNEA